MGSWIDGGGGEPFGVSGVCEGDVRAWLVAHGIEAARHATLWELTLLCSALNQDEVEQLVNTARKAFRERAERALDEDTRAWLVAHGIEAARRATRWELNLLCAALSQEEREQLAVARHRVQAERLARGKP